MGIYKSDYQNISKQTETLYLRERRVVRASEMLLELVNGTRLGIVYITVYESILSIIKISILISLYDLYCL